MIDFKILVATSEHIKYAEEISQVIESSAAARGTGIARRSKDYIINKIEEGKAVIAISKKGEFAGFCYIESWGDKFAANSGLIIEEKFRKMGLAMKVKRKAFELSRQQFPKAKLFGLTTSLAVMKINSELGYRPVTFSELTDDEQFWKGCHSCANYDILQRTKQVQCLCAGMLFDPVKEENKGTKINGHATKNLKVYGRWLRFKKFVLRKSMKWMKAAVLTLSI
ncbi:MAG: GNAT family N-acetyltransferase [Cyclobacteriaceae bacterium]|nr:GNAT family N-acetyltransferase [Cyclobacteriaceae bacterium]